MYCLNTKLTIDSLYLNVICEFLVTGGYSNIFQLFPTLPGPSLISGLFSSHKLVEVGPLECVAIRELALSCVSQQSSPWSAPCITRVLHQMACHETIAEGWGRGWGPLNLRAVQLSVLSRRSTFTVGAGISRAMTLKFDRATRAFLKLDYFKNQLEHLKITSGDIAISSNRLATLGCFKIDRNIKKILQQGTLTFPKNRQARLQVPHHGPHIW